jgi:hypothetical protein
VAHEAGGDVRASKGCSSASEPSLQSTRRLAHLQVIIVVTRHGIIGDNAGRVHSWRMFEEMARESETKVSADFRNLYPVKLKHLLHSSTE